MNAEKRRKRQLRNIICITYCSIQLLVVLLAFHGMERLFAFLEGKESVEAVNGDITIQNGDDEPEEKGLTVCIDAGHGGKDNGSDFQKRFEKDDNLRIAQAVAAYLETKDVNVVLTRSDDTFLKLEERCNIANQNEADFFVSLHRNDDANGYGVETWIYNEADEKTTALANHIMENLDTAGIQRNRGVKKGTQKSESKNYYINVNSSMPSCIVELGFIDNPEDNRLFDEKLTAYASAIGDAILSTYAEFGGDGTGGAENGSTPGEEAGGDGADAAQGTAGGTGAFVNQQIANVETLDKTSQDWGQGVNVDDKNRPVSALSFQEKYGNYQAMFIGEESQTIYLTFDEGYEYGCTESILNTLKEKGVKAVFFVTEPYAKDQPELVKRMIAEGHTVGNHSVTHPASGLPSVSMEKQQEEVLGNHQYIKDNFGYDMHLFRYPAGKFSEQSLAIVNNCNYKSIFWSFAYVDYDVNNQPEQSAALKKMTDKLHPGAIYLLHAESETNAAVLGTFIDQVRASGYEFGVIS